MNNHKQKSDVVPEIRYTVQDFIPLIVLLFLIMMITFVHQLWYGFNSQSAMRISMASFFLLFGAFKIINISEFAQAYSMYDFLAKRFFYYGYLYPFIELGLGFAYLFNWQLETVNWLTIIIMLVSAAGVFNELRKGSVITCACLGAVFKIPMTYVTLIEDLLMAFMALFMIIRG